MSLREEARPDFEQDALVLLEGADSALDDGAGLGTTTVQLGLELCQGSLGSVNNHSQHPGLRTLLSSSLT